MATRRLLLSSWTTPRCGSISSKTWKIQQTAQGNPSLPFAARFFSNDKDGSKNKNRAPTNNPDDDPFGVNFEDGNDPGKLGPSLPPRYKRDSMTGKFTGEEEVELTAKEARLLKMDPLQEQDYILEKFIEDWDLSEDKAGDSDRQAKLAGRVRQDNMGMNVLGRSVSAQYTKSTLEDGEEGYKDKTGFSKPLSPAEFKVFQKHLKDEYKSEVEDEDIPVEHTSSGESVLGGYADNDYLNTKWMSSKAMRFMDDTKDDDPFADLLPSDLSPSRLVNRRQAKPIPPQLLHHNNLALLRRYITPTGTIMNRVHSRLGATDQRRIAKLIKRARALGLIPHMGQFAVEVHGNINEKDINEDKEWEKELTRRGLTVRKSHKNIQKDEE
jgi:ribosomal protein S18